MLGLIGGSWIYGKVDDMGEFTGHNVAYVNQDLRTLYIGTFENGLMVCIILEFRSFICNKILHNHVLNYAKLKLNQSNNFRFVVENPKWNPNVVTMME